MKKTVIIILILLVHINMSAQKIEIDTFYHENEYTIFKSYEYPKYYLDSTFYSLDNRWDVDKTKKDTVIIIYSNKGDINQAYLDSLQKTTSFKNRKLLPTKRAPENFMISVNISGGCIGLFIDNIYLFYNKGEGVIIIQNSYSIKGITRHNAYRISYFRDRIAMKIIKKLNTGMYWDSISTNPPLINKVIRSGISSGDIRLYFKYNNICYENTFSGSVGYTGGYFHELLFPFWNSLSLYVSEIKPTDIEKLKKIEKSNPGLKELTGVIRGCIEDYNYNKSVISTEIKLFNDSTQPFEAKENILGYYFSQAYSNDSISLSIVSYMMDGNILNYPVYNDNSEYSVSYNFRRLLNLITFHAEKSKLCGYLDKLRYKFKNHPVFVKEIDIKRKEYCIN